MLPQKAFVVMVLVFVFLNIDVKGQTGEDVKSLMTQLFTTNGYDKEVRPILNQSLPLEVDLDMFLVAIDDIDEVTQKLTTTGFLDIVWTDEFLQWNPDDFGGVSTIFVSQSKVWKPDISLQNGFKKMTELGTSFIKMIIINEGSLRWSPFENFETKCNIDITQFPFDTQTCEIVFVVWSYSHSEVRIRKGSKGINFYQFEGNGEWEVVSTSSTVDSSSETTVKFSLTVRRIPSFYLINVIAPVILLAILNVFTYILPIDCGEKMSYSVTVFLSFAVFLSIVSSTLPKTSGSLLEYYLIFQLAMGTLVVMMTAIELRLHFCSKPVPRWLLVVLRFTHVNRGKVGEYNLKTNGNINDENTTKEGQTEKKSNELMWKDITARLDMIMFWFSLALVIIMTTMFFVSLSY